MSKGKKARKKEASYTDTGCNMLASRVCSANSFLSFGCFNELKGNGAIFPSPGLSGKRVEVLLNLMSVSGAVSA